MREHDGKMLTIVIATIVSSRGVWRVGNWTSCLGYPELSRGSIIMTACLAYTDNEEHTPEGIPSTMQLVRPSEYLLGASNGPSDCCTYSDAASEIERTNQPTDRSSGLFFCKPHRRKTLSAQYRFLPALAHARRSFFQASIEAQWFILLDDDSRVNPQLLAASLDGVDASHAVYLGDFIRWKGSPWLVLYLLTTTPTAFTPSRD